MSDEQERQDKRQEAMEWVGKAYQLHMKGEVAKAIGFYTKSIEICPTAEAYTFRGLEATTGACLVYLVITMMVVLLMGFVEKKLAVPGLIARGR